MDKSLLNLRSARIIELAGASSPRRGGPRPSGVSRRDEGGGEGRDVTAASPIRNCGGATTRWSITYGGSVISMGRRAAMRCGGWRGGGRGDRSDCGQPDGARWRLNAESSPVNGIAAVMTRRNFHPARGRGFRPATPPPVPLMRPGGPG